MHELAQTAPQAPFQWPTTVGEVMTRHPVSVRSYQPLASAHDIMGSLGVRHLPVVGEGRTVLGMVTQSGMQRFEAGAGGDVSRVRVEEAMIPHPYVVAADEPLADVLDGMIARKVRAALVTERGRLIGIFTEADAARALRRLIVAHQQ